METPVKGAGVVHCGAIDDVGQEEAVV